MIEDHNYIMCICRPKGRTTRGEPGAAIAVARLQDEGYGEWFSIYSGCYFVLLFNNATIYSRSS